METLTALLNTLNSLSPLAIIGLLGLIIYVQVTQHKELQTNDLHELPEYGELLRSMAETLRRIEISQAQAFSRIQTLLERLSK